MYGKAKNLYVREFDDYSDGTVASKINEFLQAHQDITVLDIKYTNTFNFGEGVYATEKALLIYKID